MNALDTLRFLGIFLRIKLLGMAPRFPPLPGGKLDEQTELIRRAQHVMGEVPLDDVTVEKARLDMRNTMQTLKNVGGLFERVDTVRDLDIPGPAGSIPVRLYQPGPGTGLPIFVFLHGGGWTIGGLDTASFSPSITVSRRNIPSRPRRKIVTRHSAGRRTTPPRSTVTRAGCWWAAIRREGISPPWWRR
jgi:hypothetical protein